MTDLQEREAGATPAKGERGGECARSVCGNRRAIWLNHSTRKHYCYTCAKSLNAVNRADALRLYGHDLCTLTPAEATTASHTP